MRRLFALALAALAVGPLTGCDAAFEVDLPEEAPRLVVRGLFEADSLLSVRLGRSAPALASPSADEVATATVEVYEDGVRAGTATYVERLLRYVSDVRPRPGRTYRLRVSAPGFPDAEAEETVPEPVPFEIVAFERGPEPTGGRDRVDRVTLRFEDPPGDDYYALYGLVERAYPGGEGNDQVFPLGFRSAAPALADGGFDGLLGETDDPYYVRAFFRDTPFSGGPVEIEIEVRRLEDDTDLTRITERLRLARLSETYYRYARALDSDSQAGPFGDVRRVPSNVAGGYGIFAGFAATERVLPN